MNNFPSKKDYVYGVIINAIIIIFLLSHFSGSRSVLGAQLEFASTITSIILSVIAILFTLIDSLDNKKNINKIDDSADKITNVTDKIDGSSNELKNITRQLSDLKLDEKFIEFEEILNGLNNSVTTMTTQVGNGIDEIKDKIVKPSISIKDSEVSKSNNNDVTENLHNVCLYLAKNLDEEYYHIKELIYFISKLRQLDKPMEFKIIDSYIKTQINDTSDKLFLIGKCYCIIGLLANFDCLHWMKDTHKIYGFNDKFFEITEWMEENRPDIVKNINDFIEHSENDK